MVLAKLFTIVLNHLSAQEKLKNIQIDEVEVNFESSLNMCFQRVFNYYNICDI